MKAFTCHGRWAWSIAIGAKPTENRGQGTTYRGPVAIHAGVKVSQERIPDLRVQERWDRMGGNSALWNAGWTRINARKLPTEQAIGAIIALGELVDCHKAIDVPRLDGTDGTCCEPWGNRSYPRTHHIVVVNVRILTEAVPCRGFLGLWTVPDEVAALVVANCPASPVEDRHVA